MAQASGSSAEILYKIETTNGVTPSVDGGASTTLSKAVNPGETQIEVVDTTGVLADEILKIGNDNNMEFVKVLTVVSGTVLDLSPDTKVNYRHESGEAVVETDPKEGWYKLGNVRSFAPSGGRELQRSQALTGTRVLSNFREGNYDAGADMTVEMDIGTAGLFYLHSLNSDYTSTGSTQNTTPVSQLTSGALTKGATSVTLDGAVNLVADKYILIDTGDNAELVKVDSGYTTGNSFNLDTTAHPNGLRKDHADGVAAVEKIAPFTHEIKRGSTIPEGITFLLRFTDINSAMLIRGNKISNLTLNVDPSDLPTLDMNVVGKAFQILQDDSADSIFGTPTILSSTPYAHWESVVSVGDAGMPLVEQTDNQFESLSVVIENTINANFVVGSPIKGAITPGEGNVTGSFTYQFGSQQFADKTVAGTESNLNFKWTYIGDDNHSLEIDIPRAKFEGNPHPGVSSKDPITDDKSFVGRLDNTAESDVVVKYMSVHPTAEFPG